MLLKTYINVSVATGRLFAGQGVLELKFQTPPLRRGFRGCPLWFSIALAKEFCQVVSKISMKNTHFLPENNPEKRNDF